MSNVPSKELLLKNNENKELSDLEWIEEFYEFLQGEIPEGIHLLRGHKPQLSQKKAFAIIWYLQEHFSILPDHIERCDNCGSLFDQDGEGIYWETKGKHFLWRLRKFSSRKLRQGQKVI